MKRAISVEQLLNKTFDDMHFQGRWRDAIGTPEKSGVWIIWGNSGNGKTRFCMQLAKYLTEFGKVAYDTLEEGARKSFKIAVGETNMVSCGKRFMILDREPIEELRERLMRRKSPSIIFIDSLQYTTLTKRSYIALKEDFPNKLFIFISHAEGRNPEGRLGKAIRYDADVKIRVEGFKAFPASRYGGNKEYVIWEEGAANFWGEDE